MIQRELDKIYYLSTEGYSFKYRRDRYNPLLIHVELFKNGDLVHKQIAEGYGMNRPHHDIINSLEAKIQLNELDPTGLKQIIPSK